MAKLRTYRKWQKRGRQVARGERARSFNENGKALFTKSQTYIPCVYTRADYECRIDMSDYERELDDDLAMAHGLH